ncbi:MAG: 30S ribosomal protein S5 [Candidatus Woesearchaeota archaeon]|nr:30S ribosomal protein S5 [Candidatus Woesearchaeota archaeon]
MVEENKNEDVKSSKEMDEGIEFTKEAIIKEEEEIEVKIVPKSIETWVPKTNIGRKVLAGEIKDIEYIIDNGIKILEPEIVDYLVPNIQSELLLVGQAKGKFGGGQRRVFRQTQKKTMEGNKPKFSTIAVIGNKDGLIGMGSGKAKETVPAREKAFRNAKLNVIKIRRGCGSWQCGCGTPHSIPFKVSGKFGSVEIILMPAPKGKGLCIQSECQKMLALAGIKDVWSKVKGQSGTRSNLLYACFNALKKLSDVKVQERYKPALGVEEGAIKGNVGRVAENV